MDMLLIKVMTAYFASNWVHGLAALEIGRELAKEALVGKSLCQLWGNIRPLMWQAVLLTKGNL